MNFPEIVLLSGKTDKKGISNLLASILVAGKSPARRLVIAAAAFSIGILTAPVLSLGLKTRLILGALVFVISLVLFLVQKYQPLQSILIVLFWIILGFTAGFRGTIDTLPRGKTWIYGTITLPIESNDNGFRFRLQDITTRQASKTGTIPGKAVVLIEKSDLYGIKQLWAGDRVSFIGNLTTFTGPRNPGDFNSRVYWGVRGIKYRINVGSGFKIVKRNDNIYDFNRFTDIVRKKIVEVFGSNISPHLFPTAKALFIGDRTGWDLSEREMFAKSGLMHLFAISGLHTGIIAYLLFQLFNVLRLNRTISQVLIIGLLWLYIPVGGANPPVIRAVVMITIALSGNLFGRLYRSGYALLLAYILLLAWRPDNLFDAGFQLSFAGTAGVLFAFTYIVPREPLFLPLTLNPLKRQFFQLWDINTRYLWISLSAFVFTLPFILLHFGRIPWFGFIFAPYLNLFLLLAMTAGWLAFGFSFLLSVISEAFGASFNLVLHLMYALVKLSSENLFVSEFLSRDTITWALLALIVFVVLSPGYKRLKIKTLAILFLSFANLIVWSMVWAPAQETKLAVLDVGQGDGIIIRRGERAVVIDGGPPPGYALQRQLMTTGIKSVDLLLVTHGDADHASAAQNVIGRIPIKAALIGPGTTLDEQGYKTTKALLDNNIPVFVGVAGCVIELGKMGIFSILSPGAEINLSEYSDNDLSLVTLWETDGIKALFPGDISDVVEKQLVTDSCIPEVDILVAAHHGSKHSTGKSWLEALDPDYVVISCGRNNPYGHPADEVLERIQKEESQVFRTDISGAILFKTGRQGIKQISSYRKW